MSVDVHALIEENARLRNKLLEIAKECSGCGGAGVVTVKDDMVAAFGRELPCPDCEDIREALE